METENILCLKLFQGNLILFIWLMVLFPRIHQNNMGNNKTFTKFTTYLCCTFNKQNLRVIFPLKTKHTIQFRKLSKTQFLVFFLRFQTYLVCLIVKHKYSECITQEVPNIPSSLIQISLMRKIFKFTFSQKELLVLYLIEINIKI